MTLILLAIITGILSYFTILKMKSAAEIDYKVITFDKYNICFLVNPSYIIEKNEDVFKYQAGKNLGEFKILHRPIDPTIKQTYIGDFKGGYKKEVDIRVFEYEIAEGVVLQDRFDFVKKLPANILPVRNNCSKYLERFSIILAL